LNYFWNHIRRVRKIIGRADIERNHVIDKVIGPAAAQLAPVLTGFFGPLQNIIVNVGHILSIADRNTLQLQVADELVIAGIGKSMSEVGCVVRGNAAHV
jgi:hypothetical protein